MSNLNGKITDFVVKHHNGCTNVKVGLLILGIGYAIGECLNIVHKNGYICGVEDCKKITEEVIAKHQQNDEEAGA